MNPTLIGIPSTGRDTLHTLLESLNCQHLTPDVRIQIVDNRPPNQPRIAGLPATSVEVEVRQIGPPGVSSARNAILDTRRRGEDVVFLDDDQVCDASWWVDYCRHRRLHPRNIISGEVIFYGEVASRGWLPDNRTAQNTARKVQTTGTGNTAIPAEYLDAAEPRFDPAFNSGGEDTHFFYHSLVDGIEIIKVSGMRVSEHVPISRTTPRYHRQKWRRTGKTRALIARKQGTPSPIIAIQGVARLASAPILLARSTRTANQRFNSGLGYLGALTNRNDTQ